MKHIRRELARLASAVMPNECVYVVIPGDLPRSERSRFTVAGASSPCLTAIFRATIKASGQWRGWHPTIYLDPAGKFRDCTDRATRRRLAPSIVFGVMIHELSHVLDSPAAVKLTPNELREARRRFRLAVARRTPVSGAPVPWLWHETAFLRGCLHLVYRARAAGFDVFPEDVFDSEYYGLSNTYRYSRALGDEPERLAGLPIREALAMPMPRHFTALFERDNAAYFERLRGERIAACSVPFDRAGDA